MIFQILLLAFCGVLAENVITKNEENQYKNSAQIVGITIPTKFNSGNVIYIPNIDNIYSEDMNSDEKIRPANGEQVGAILSELNQNSKLDNEKTRSNNNGQNVRQLINPQNEEELIIISTKPSSQLFQNNPLQTTDTRTFSTLNQGNIGGMLNGGGGRVLNGGRGISRIISSLQNLQNVLNNPTQNVPNRGGINSNLPFNQNMPQRGLTTNAFGQQNSGGFQGNGMLSNLNTFVPMNQPNLNVPIRGGSSVTNPGVFSTFNQPTQNWPQGSASGFGSSFFAPNHQGNVLDLNTPPQTVTTFVVPLNRQSQPDLDEQTLGDLQNLVGSPYLIQFPEFRQAVGSGQWYPITSRLSDPQTHRDNQQYFHVINKRSLPIVKLIHNPNVKLDFPKTIQNLGTVAKNSFEDKNAPMHHMNNLFGSVKNVFLSALKIPPQDIIIPSQYKIINTDEIDKLGAIGPSMYSVSNSDDDQYNDIVTTFHKVGTVLRDSIRSTHETFGHAGDIAHSARKVIHTARFSTPRLIIPYAKAPVLQHANTKKRNKKVMLIAPKILGLSRESPQTLPENFVRVGHIMDALGMSNPTQKRFGIEKIVLQPKTATTQNLRRKSSSKISDLVGMSNARRNAKKSYFVRTRSGFEENDDDVVKAINTLEAAEESSGVGNLKDLITKMKEDLNVLLRNRMDEYKTKTKKASATTTLQNARSKQTDHAIEKEVSHLMNNLLENQQNSDPQKDTILGKARVPTTPKQSKTIDADCDDDDDENVGAGLPLAANLLKPFMGRPSRRNMVEFLKENGDEVDEADDMDDDIVGDALNEKVDQMPDVDQILGAINPVMFEKFLSESLNVNSTTSPKDMLQVSDNANAGEVDNILGQIPGQKVRISMDIDKHLLKPFINKPSKDNINDYLNHYNSQYDGEKNKIEESNADKNDVS